MTTRETFGERILRARSGRWTRPQLSERLKKEFNKKVSISTIQDLENDDAPNPGVKTVEAVALGVNLDPLSTIALLLDDPPEESLTQTETQIAKEIVKGLKQVRPEKKPFAQELTRLFLKVLDEYREPK